MPIWKSRPSSRFKIREPITYRDIDINWKDLITMAKAIKILDVSLSSLTSVMERSERFHVIIDTQSTGSRQGRRLLIRKEVEAAAKASSSQ